MLDRQFYNEIWEVFVREARSLINEVETSESLQELLSSSPSHKQTRGSPPTPHCSVFSVANSRVLKHWQTHIQ